jgi:hypothetical protein
MRCEKRREEERRTASKGQEKSASTELRLMLSALRKRSQVITY